MVVHHEDALGAQEAGGCGRHQADRPGPEDGHGRALADGGVDCSHVAGGQDVREEQHLPVGQARILDDERPDVGLGHPHEFGLAAGNAAIQVAVSEQCGAGAGVLLVDDGAAARVGRLAGGEELAVAEEAFAARDRERDDDAVAHLHARDGGSGFLDDAHEFVAEDVAAFHHRDLSAIDVQVGAADRGRGDAQDDVVGLDDPGVRDAFDAHVLRAVVGEGFHRNSVE